MYALILYKNNIQQKQMKEATNVNTALILYKNNIQQKLDEVGSKMGYMR